MTTNPNRVPSGVPTGGQFAAGKRAEQPDDLDPNAPPGSPAVPAVIAAINKASAAREELEATCEEALVRGVRAEWPDAKTVALYVSDDDLSMRVWEVRGADGENLYPDGDAGEAMTVDGANSLDFVASYLPCYDRAGWGDAATDEWDASKPGSGPVVLLDVDATLEQYDEPAAEPDDDDDVDDVPPAQWAARRMSRVLDEQYDDAEPSLASAARDLVTDLRHWCDQNGVDFHQVVDRSFDRYLEERRDARR